MKNLFKVALIAGTMALTTVGATVGASAAGIGIHVGPIGVGVGVHNHHHRACNRDHWGHRHCFWR